VIAAGVDLAMASGDKLLGGPQAGIIVGRAELVRVVERHPLARAVRADKVALAGIAETLRHYLRGDAEQQIPVWRMISTSVGELLERGRTIVAALREVGAAAELVESRSSVGGGSLPGETLPSWSVRLNPGPESSADDLAQRLRTGDMQGRATGVFGRIEAGSVLLDLRTVLPEDDERLVDAVVRALEADH
jgi:L-seryl-tRNA(Ser) seleniumtransferase